MPDTLLRSSPLMSLPRAATRTRVPSGFYERTVLRALSRLTRGFLQVTFPDGEVFSVGSETGEVKASMRILNRAFFRKCVLFGDVGFGESYVDGDWDSPNVTDVVRWMVLNVENHPAMSGSRKRFSPINWLRWANRLWFSFRANTQEGSRRNIRDHYDLGNDFFQLILDKTMTYSSAYFASADESLERAQERKYDALCKKLHLRSTDRVLEIGSGWGGFAIHAAKHYGCRVTTITISKAQYALAEQRIKQAGLSDRIELRLQDYRKVTGQFDKIASIEMLEAVGHGFLKSYFRQCHHLLAPQGALGLQVITCPDSRYHHLRKGVDWIQKHIFPGSLLPSVGVIHSTINAAGDWVLHDLEDLGPHYARTLALWRENLLARWASIRALGYDESFRRKWQYYFSYCEAAFAMRNITVLQMVYSRPNNRAL